MSTATFSHEHLVRDLTARVLDRLASQEPARIPPVLEALDLTHMDRLAAIGGVAIQGGCPHELSREALDLVAHHLEHEVKTNPSATAIHNGDLVLIAIGREDVEANLKGVVNRLGNQLKAVEHSSAILALALEGFDEWPKAAQSKISGLVGRHPHPRIFLTIGQAPGAAPSPLFKCVSVEIGEESAPCRRRSMTM